MLGAALAHIGVAICIDLDWLASRWIVLEQRRDGGLKKPTSNTEDVPPQQSVEIKRADRPKWNKLIPLMSVHHESTRPM